MSKGGSDTNGLVVAMHRIEGVFGLTSATAHERYHRLTRRERQVAAMIAAGTPNEQIAVTLTISRKTLDIHRTHIKAKLAASTLAHIANLVNLVRVLDLAQPIARLGDAR